MCSEQFWKLSEEQYGSDEENEQYTSSSRNKGKTMSIRKEY